jgi:hypothetical protein
MCEQPMWVVAAAPAAIVSVLCGTFLLGQSLKCTGDLEAILDGVTGRAALLPMLRHAVTHPVDLLTYALPVFLGVWLLLLANSRLRHRPPLAVILGLFPFVALIVGSVAIAPHVCDLGPSALSLALVSGGFFAAFAAGIFLVVRPRA